MNAIVKDYRATMKHLGAMMLVWAILLNGLMMIYMLLDELFAALLIPVAAEIAGSLAYDAAYLLAFMIPPVFYRIMRTDGKRLEPMRMEIKLGWDSIAFIFGGIACLFAFAYLNSIIVSLIDAPLADSVITEAEETLTRNGISLQFNTIALVPAFCEEFLFRGVVLSNLMPYGKGLAILISSVFFGLMHGNMYQFLYTTAAGVVLGLIYVLTDSIWCSILMHAVNNSISVLQSVFEARLTDRACDIAIFTVEAVIFLLGVISVSFLAVKYGKRARPSHGRAERVFGRMGSDVESIGTDRRLSPSEALKGFFRPVVIGFIAYAVFSGISMLIAM